MLNSLTVKMDRGDLVDDRFKYFKAMGDKSRFEILKTLKSRNMTGRDVEKLIKLKQPSVSHHMKILVDAELVCENRAGKYCFYSLNLNQLEEVHSFIHEVIDFNN